MLLNQRLHNSGLAVRNDHSTNLFPALKFAEEGPVLGI
jgi:hypothetical protein